MIQILSKKYVLLLSLILVSVMFTTVMFIVNPLIDGKNGLEVIALQLSFQKSSGLKIANGWGESGISNFKKWIFTDYFYALSYALFLGSLLSGLIVKNGKEKQFSYTWVIPLAFIAGFLDWIENTIELLFLNNPTDCSNMLFFVHSIIATIKWGAIPVITVYIMVLLFQHSNK